MSGKTLLDTTVVIALFSQDPAAQTRLSQADEVFVPSIVLGELYYGARKSTRIEENLARIDEFAANNAVLVCNLETARRYGLVKRRLQEKGRPLPENDIWIAAIAMQYGLTIVSHDAHFGEVDGVLVETW